MFFINIFLIIFLSHMHPIIILHYFDIKLLKNRNPNRYYSLQVRNPRFSNRACDIWKVNGILHPKNITLWKITLAGNGSTSTQLDRIWVLFSILPPKQHLPSASSTFSMRPVAGVIVQPLGILWILSHTNCNFNQCDNLVNNT